MTWFATKYKHLSIYKFYESNVNSKNIIIMYDCYMIYIKEKDIKFHARLLFGKTFGYNIIIIIKVTQMSVIVSVYIVNVYIWKLEMISLVGNLTDLFKKSIENNFEQ